MSDDFKKVLDEFGWFLVKRYRHLSDSAKDEEEAIQRIKSVSVMAGPLCYDLLTFLVKLRDLEEFARTIKEMYRREQMEEIIVSMKDQLNAEQ